MDILCLCGVIIGALLFSLAGYYRSQPNWEVGLAIMFAGCIFLVGGLAGFSYFSQPETSDTYYLPCEIVSVNETSTYFGTVDQDIQMIYAAETGDHDWPDDVPYLLCMDSMGTKDIADDAILVVWRTD